MLKVIPIMLFAYVLGSVPFALIVTKLVKGVDIRNYGSGNTGATNAYRVMGFGMGVLVALLDIGKGFLAVKSAQLLFSETPIVLLVVGIMAIAGHNWSLFLKFDGGRGVATSVGVLISLAPKAILIVFLIWVVIVITTRYVSLGSIIGAISVPILMLLFGRPTVYVIFGLLIAIFVVYRHRPNIKRLLAGEENRISWNPGGKDL